MQGCKAMYYLSEIDENRKVNSTLFMSNGEKDIEYLGWDKEEKEKTGVFVDELPEQDETQEGDGLYLDDDNRPYWKYTGKPRENFEADMAEMAIDHEMRLSMLEIGLTE